MDVDDGAIPDGDSEFGLTVTHGETDDWESGHEFTIPSDNEDGEPEGDEFSQHLTEWNGESNMILISGPDRFPVPGGSSLREDNAMNQGVVDWRIGDNVDEQARDMTRPVRGDLSTELLLSIAKGQEDTVICDGGVPIRRETPPCRLCEAQMDQPSLNRVYSIERDWYDSIANEAAAVVGGMLCRNCRIRVCELRHENIYHVMSREEYIRSLLYCTSDVQAAINRLQFCGLGVHMYIPPLWWDALNWVLIEAEQVVHRQIAHQRVPFASPGEVQRAITRLALNNITILEVRYFLFSTLNPVDLQNLKVWCQMEVMAEQYVADFRMHIPTQAQLAKQREDERKQQKIERLQKMCDELERRCQSRS